MKQRVIKILLVFSLVLSVFSFGAKNIAAENTDEEKALLKELLLYYTQYRNAEGYVSDYTSEADYDIDRILADLSEKDPYLGQAWKDALEYWDDALYPFGGDFGVNEGVLPDGLPNDESLAIVCLGYALNKTTGEMEDELIGRLQVTLDSWKKYPNAVIAVTGGGTAPQSAHPEHTEGGEMKKWLMEQGVPEDKIICEDQAKNTYGNAANTYAILAKDYPEVTDVAIITSQYHVPRGCVLFEIQFLETAAENEEECKVHVVSNAGFYVEKPNYAANGGYEGFNMFSMQVPSIAGVSLGGWGQPTPKPELSYADDEMTLNLKSNEVIEGKNPEIASASFVVHSGDEFNGDITINVDPSEIASDIDSSKLGDQTVTFSYTWKKGTAYEKTFTVTKDVKVVKDRTEEKALLKELLLYYTQYRNAEGYVSDYTSEADYDIDRILADLSEKDPYLGQAWKDALEYWDDALYPFGGDFGVNEGVLPDGLPNDESLAIVCLGYALNKTTGEMEDELIGRLQVTLDSWKKYPNAVIAVTGGGTAPQSAHPEHTEGGEMKKWLMEQGVPEDKIICEDQAKNTYGNAANTYAILAKDYPEVTDVAIITSQYHVPRGCVLFEIQFLETAAENEEECKVHVVSNAGFYVEKPNYAANGGYEGFNMFSMQVPSIAGVSLGGWGQPTPKPELSYADDEMTLNLKSNEVIEGKNPEIASASFVVHSGDEFNGDITINVDPSEIASDIDSSKLGDQTVTFSYTWKKGTAYEKTITAIRNMTVLGKPEYSCVSGNGTVIIVGKDQDLKFTIKRNYRDEETFSLFKEIKVDGSTLSPDYYTVEAGSLKAVIDGSFIKTLKTGSHNFEVVFEDGSSSVTLNIAKKAAPAPADKPVYVAPLTGVERIQSAY